MIKQFQVQGEHRRIVYTVTEYEPLLDSSNMSFTDWMKIAQDIKVRQLSFNYSVPYASLLNFQSYLAIL